MEAQRQENSTVKDRLDDENTAKAKNSSGPEESPRGPLLFASCAAGRYLADNIVAQYGRSQSQLGGNSISYAPGIDFRFSDGETCVRVDAEIGGHDVFLFQSLFDPRSQRSIDDNYVAFLAAVRTFREHGANYVTGILPYLAYARQDKPSTFEREPTTAKLMADLSIAAGIDRLLTWHPHAPQVPGFYAKVPVTVLEMLPFFESAFSRFRGRQDAIIVAPDAGAAKLVSQLSQRLDVMSAVAAKIRPRAEEAVITAVMGDFDGKRVALVPDDMISSGGTVDALISKLTEEIGIAEVHLAASHNLCSESAYERLGEQHRHGRLRRLVVTNSIPQTTRFLAWPFLEIYDLSDIMVHSVDRIHHNRAVDHYRP